MGEVKHIPVTYDSGGRDKMTISVSVKRETVESIELIARANNSSKSKVVQDLLTKALEKEG